ncbi:Mu transposase C-terminal domain-containing protein, partial [Pseudanabaenaceae cyanobacterium LEGE 13415]|nr:Mu transposase C-terminal domain-containing protein [Pseudanabaenaceae cyanobacterium LEGE 13415]
WGVPEQVRTDHGKEYLSQRVQRFLATLNVDTEDLRCLPGHPEQKPFVERFNRTFQHRDLVKSPFFIGHNVSDRQTLRKSPGRGNSCIELAMSIADFQRWCDLWVVEYEQRPHGRAGIGLEGKSPLEVLAEAVEAGWTNRIIQNPRELDWLMMAAPGRQGMRKVGRQGISVSGRLYVAAELSTWIGRSVYVCFDPHEPRKIYVYGSVELTEFVCEADWRQAEGVDLAAIALQARHLYEVLLRSVNQIRKRGKALLRKLASDPYLLVGQTAESLEQVMQSQLHLYPAINGVTAAITASESTPEETATIDLETYHQELQRLEAESQQQALQQEQQRLRQQQLEQLVDRWQQRQACPGLEVSEREMILQYLNAAEGRGFLIAVTASTHEEQQFLQWLSGQIVMTSAIVNYRALLETTIVHWRTQQAVPLEDKHTLLHYIREPEGFGVLRAYLNDTEEREFQIWLKQEPRS